MNLSWLDDFLTLATIGNFSLAADDLFDAAKLVGDVQEAEEVLQDSAPGRVGTGTTLRSNARKAVELGRCHYAQQSY